MWICFFFCKRSFWFSWGFPIPTVFFFIGSSPSLFFALLAIFASLSSIAGILFHFWTTFPSIFQKTFPSSSLFLFFLFFPASFFPSFSNFSPPSPLPQFLNLPFPKPTPSGLSFSFSSFTGSHLLFQTPFCPCGPQVPPGKEIYFWIVLFSSGFPWLRSVGSLRNSSQLGPMFPLVFSRPLGSPLMHSLHPFWRFRRILSLSL